MSKINVFTFLCRILIDVYYDWFKVKKPEKKKNAQDILYFVLFSFLKNKYFGKTFVPKRHFMYSMHVILLMFQNRCYSRFFMSIKKIV